MFAALLLALGRSLAPADFLRLPRRRPGPWLALAALYPVLSVLPQGMIFRVFFVHRYGRLLEIPSVLLGAVRVTATPVALGKPSSHITVLVRPKTLTLFYLWPTP